MWNKLMFCGVGIPTHPCFIHINEQSSPLFWSGTTNTVSMWNIFEIFGGQFHGQVDRHTDRPTNRQTSDRQTDRKTDKLSGRQMK